MILRDEEIFYSYQVLFPFIIILKQIIFSSILSALALYLVFLNMDITASISALILCSVGRFFSALACQIYQSPVATILSTGRMR